MLFLSQHTLLPTTVRLMRHQTILRSTPLWKPGRKDREGERVKILITWAVVLGPDWNEREEWQK